MLTTVCGKRVGWAENKKMRVNLMGAVAAGVGVEAEAQRKCIAFDNK